MSHDVTEIIIAFIDVHTHRFATVAGEVSPQFGGKDTNKKLESLKQMRISSLFLYNSEFYKLVCQILELLLRSNCKLAFAFLLRASAIFKQA